MQPGEFFEGGPVPEPLQHAMRFLACALPHRRLGRRRDAEQYDPHPVLGGFGKEIRIVFIVFADNRLLRRGHRADFGFQGLDQAVFFEFGPQRSDHLRAFRLPALRIAVARLVARDPGVDAVTIRLEIAPPCLEQQQLAVDHSVCDIPAELDELLCARRLSVVEGLARRRIDLPFEFVTGNHGIINPRKHVVSLRRPRRHRRQQEQNHRCRWQELECE